MENLRLKDEEIIELLKEGFKADLIAFEFDISVEKVRECEKILNKRKKPEHNTMQINIKSIKENLNNSTAKAKVLKQLYIDLERCTLTIEEYIELIEALSNVNLKDVASNERQAYVNLLQRVKEKIKIKLNSQITTKLTNSNSLEELKELSKKCDLINNKYKNTMGIGIDKYQINRKIERLQQQEVIKEANRIKSPEIEKIVIQIANGTLNIEEAINIINEEAKKQLENKPKKFGSLTLEQEKNKICMQINRALRDETEKYPINNTKLAIEYLEQLSGNKENSITTVVKNLIARKKFKEAREICNIIPATSEHTESPFKRMLENEIKKAELGIQSVQQRGVIR